MLQPINPDEIPAVARLVPESWDLDIEAYYKLHFGKPYFRAICIRSGEKVVGTGSVLLHDGVSWLGTILVDPDFQKQGIGRTITDYLVTYSKHHGAVSILLTASEQGERLYRSMGFRKESDYIFLQNIGQNPSAGKVKTTGKPSPDAVKGMLKLDREINGENRKAFLSNFLITAHWVTENEEVTGFYLPDLGNGLVLANDEHTGLYLLSVARSNTDAKFVIPEQNSAALKFLKSQGYVELHRAPRMYLLTPCPWKPEKIFNRGAGYCG
jgi:ribosomal protein S18 acetylase RimI-like enzyme